MFEETLSNHLLANSLWELEWCYEWTSGCVVSGVCLDKPSKPYYLLLEAVELHCALKKRREQNRSPLPLIFIWKMSHNFLIILSHLLFQYLNLYLSMFSYHP